MNQASNPKCAVVGYGSWATAIVKTLTINHHHVDWLVLNDDIRESLETRSLNSKYLPWCYIDHEFFTASADINEVARDAFGIPQKVPRATDRKPCR